MDPCECTPNQACMLHLEEPNPETYIPEPLDKYTYDDGYIYDIED
jgi:hypothetical protein